MAKAYICDRCGKTVKHSELDEVLKFRGDRIVYELTMCRDGYKSINVDLCPECQEALGKWLVS